MTVSTAHHLRPDWDRIYERAILQDGHFTTAQAAESGYSPQLLNKYLRNGRIVRIRRGIYRIVHFPDGAHEDMAVLWLWSEHAGVFSHETALSLRDLSDILPARPHMTLPLSWEKRRPTLHLRPSPRSILYRIPRGDRPQGRNGPGIAIGKRS